jgi:predicted nucleotidyltransferase
MPRLTRRTVFSTVDKAKIKVSMSHHGIDFDSPKIAEFCRRYGIVRLSLFGSILRDDFGPESDVDVLVEFPGMTPSLLDLGGMQQELSAIVGRTVDLKTWGFLSSRIRGRVERERQVQFAI